MQPRPAHYALAHQLLRDDALGAPARTWSVLSGPQAAAYLQARWAAAAGSAGEASALAVVARQRFGQSDILVVSLPPPRFPTEAYLVALARQPGGALRYFVMEKGISGPGDPPRAYVAEWRDAMRIRYGDLPALTLEAFVAQVATEILSMPETATSPPIAYAPAAHARRSRAPRWIALGAAGAAVLLAGGWFVWRQVELARIVEEQREREAAVRAAEESLEPVVARAEQRHTDLVEEFASCRERERHAIERAIEAAERRGAWKERKRTPRDRPALKGALAYLPDGRTPIHALPESAWIAERASACPAAPGALAELGRALDEEIVQHEGGRVEALAEQKRRLERLLTELEEVDPALELPEAVVVVNRRCATQVVASFTSTPTGERLDLKSYSCTATLTWLRIPDGSTLAALSARANAQPLRDPGAFTTDVALAEINRETERRASEQVSNALARQIERLGGAR